MLKPVLASLATVAVLTAAPAGAQLRTPDSHFYGGAGIGRSESDITGSIDRSDNSWKAFGGYQFNKNFALEGGYTDLGSSTTLGASFDSVAWHAFAVGMLPINEQFGLLGKVGLAQTQTDVSGFGTRNSNDPAYGLGLRYDFTRQVGIRGEWERFRVDGSPLVGKSNTDLFSVSGVFRFY